MKEFLFERLHTVNNEFRERWKSFNYNSPEIDSLKFENFGKGIIFITTLQ